MDYWPFFSSFPQLWCSPFISLLGDVVPSHFWSASLSLPIRSSVELFFWRCQWLWVAYVQLGEECSVHVLISHVMGSLCKITLLKFCSPLPAEPGNLSGMCLMWTVTRLLYSNLCSAAVWVLISGDTLKCAVYFEGDWYLLHSDILLTLTLCCMLVFIHYSCQL